MIRRPPRSTLSSSSAASDVYKRQSFYSRSALQYGLLFLAVVVIFSVFLIIITMRSKKKVLKSEESERTHALRTQAHWAKGREVLSRAKGHIGHGKITKMSVIQAMKDHDKPQQSQMSHASDFHVSLPTLPVPTVPVLPPAKTSGDNQLSGPALSLIHI